MIAIDPPPPGYPDSDRLKQLRSFCQVVRWRSFTRAAEHLGLGQSSVSQQVRSLEAELAATLFERDGRRITLTPAGEDLYRLTASLVAGMDRLPDTFAEEHTGRLPPELRIAAGEAASTFILPPFLKQFRDAHPGTRLFVRSGTGREATGCLQTVCRVTPPTFSARRDAPVTAMAPAPCRRKRTDTRISSWRP